MTTTPWNQTGYGYQTTALGARDEEEPPTYPCDVCGGIGFTGQNLTVPCRTCGTTGERTATPPPAPPLPPPPGAADSPWTRPLTDDPWMDPEAAAKAGPPPF